MASAKDYLAELRVQDAYKNLLILLAPFFGKKLFVSNYYHNLVLGFLALFLNSSACYIINDIRDAPFDIYHPKKKQRPIASGKIGKLSAFSFSLILIAVSFIISYLIGTSFLILSLLLFLNSLTYTVLLKEIVWLDLISVSLNYIIRTLAGCEVVKVSISPWLLMGVFYVSIILVLAKRREELVSLEKPELHRKPFKHYTISIIDQTIAIFSTLILISYSLYTFHSLYSNNLLPFTIPIVTLIILQFITISRNINETGIIRKILANKIMIASLLLWLIVMFYLIYVM